MPAIDLYPVVVTKMDQRRSFSLIPRQVVPDMPQMLVPSCRLFLIVPRNYLRYVPNRAIALALNAPSLR